MKRFTLYITLLTLLLSSCGTEPVPIDNLTILGGINNNQLVFEGKAGSSTTFAIASKLPWELLDTPGVTYSPSSGEATERVTITATVTNRKTDSKNKR